MSRLIDADALNIRDVSPEYGRVVMGVTEDDIDDAPTIEPMRWIPCSSGRMPEEPFGCIVTVWDTNPVTMDEFENLLPYFVGWDGEQWNDSDGEQCPFEVIAWCKLPAPYKGGET